jgi:hypothetical protein
MTASFHNEGRFGPIKLVYLSEVSVPSQESEWSCIWVLGVSIFPLFQFLICDNGARSDYPSGAPCFTCVNGVHVVYFVKCVTSTTMFALFVYLKPYWCPTRFPHRTMVFSFNSSTTGVRRA